MPNQYTSERCSQCGAPWETPNITSCRRCRQRENDRRRAAAKKAKKDAELNENRKDRKWCETHCFICGALRSDPNQKCRRCQERVKRQKKRQEQNSKTLQPRDIENLNGLRFFIQNRRRRLAQDENAPMEGIDY